MKQRQAYRYLHKRYSAFIFKESLLGYEDRVAFRKMKKGRGFSRFEDLPEWVQHKCTTIKTAAIELIPNSRVYLIGSWVNGGWVDENTAQKLREIRYKIKKTWAISDIDVVIHSDPPINVKALKAKVDFPFDFTYFNLKTTPYLEIP